MVTYGYTASLKFRAEKELKIAKQEQLRFVQQSIVETPSAPMLD